MVSTASLGRRRGTLWMCENAGRRRGRRGDGRWRGRGGCCGGICALTAPPAAAYSARTGPAGSYVDRRRRGGGGECPKVSGFVHPEIRRVVRDLGLNSFRPSNSPSSLQPVAKVARADLAPLPLALRCRNSAYFAQYSSFPRLDPRANPPRRAARDFCHRLLSSPWVRCEGEKATCDWPGRQPRQGRASWGVGATGAAADWGVMPTATA